MQTYYTTNIGAFHVSKFCHVFLEKILLANGVIFSYFLHILSSSALKVFKLMLRTKARARLTSSFAK